MEKRWKIRTNCELCEDQKERTTKHIMSECTAFAELRLQMFGTPFPQPPYLMSIDKVFSFLKEAKIKSLEMYKDYQEYLDDMNSSQDEENITQDREQRSLNPRSVAAQLLL